MRHLKEKKNDIFARISLNSIVDQNVFFSQQDADHVAGIARARPCHALQRGHLV